MKTFWLPDIKPDIVYLDIQMSGIDGIAVGNSLLKSYPAAIIIIVTSFPEYLDDAMRFPCIPIYFKAS